MLFWHVKGRTESVTMSGSFVDREQVAAMKNMKKGRSRCKSAPTG
jgi:hypothetical protein